MGLWRRLRPDLPAGQSAEQQLGELYQARFPDAPPRDVTQMVEQFLGTIVSNERLGGKTAIIPPVRDQSGIVQIKTVTPRAKEVFDQPGVVIHERPRAASGGSVPGLPELMDGANPHG